MQRINQVKIINVIIIVSIIIFDILFRNRLYNNLEAGNDKNIIIFWFFVFWVIISLIAVIPLIINLFNKNRATFIRNQKSGLVLFFIFVIIADIFLLLSKTTWDIKIVVLILNILCYSLYKFNNTMELE